MVGGDPLDRADRGLRLLRVRLLLLGIAGLALALRAVGAGDVFPGGGDVVLSIWDSAYHARRAFFSFEAFPALLTFDGYMSYPDGAVVPMPPLYDWALGGVARLLASSEMGFARVAAWWSPAWGVLAVLPCYAMGRALGGRGAGLVAAALLAVLPAGAFTSGVGDVDHHAAAALLAASFASLSVSLALPDLSRRDALGLGVALASCRAALLLTWSGSLLPLAVGEAALLASGLAAGSPRRLAVQAASALAAALLVAPWVALAPEPPGGPLTPTTLSWLHVAALAAAAAVASAMAVIEQRRPLGSAWARVLRGAGIAGVVGIPVLAVPALRAALAPGVAFLLGEDPWAPTNAEQKTLFASGGARQLFGYFAYAIPVAALAVLARARDPRLRAAALGLALWTAALAVLALSQVRFANEFAPFGAVAFALGLAELHAALARRLPAVAAGAVATALAGLLLWPAITEFHAPGFARAGALLSGDAEETGPHSLTRFARAIREVTPETSGYLDELGHPEYGVLCKPSHGHVIQWVARRATSANGFGPYLDPEKYETVLEFFRTGSESRAYAIARELGARYVMTYAHEGLVAGRLAGLLHRLDGSTVDGTRHAGHFRLVAEGPPGGVPLWSAFPRGAPDSVVPYKLFEVVEGARIEARLDPAALLAAALTLVTPEGRRFLWRGVAAADALGVASLRVPYATEASTPVRASGVYRVVAGGRVRSLAVSERDVREGRTLALFPTPLSAP